ncbi:hypothetical protein MTO96_012010 [Rhipicephalus appendiculatus]
MAGARLIRKGVSRAVASGLSVHVLPPEEPKGAGPPHWCRVFSRRSKMAVGRRAPARGGGVDDRVLLSEEPVRAAVSPPMTQRAPLPENVACRRRGHARVVFDVGADIDPDRAAR